MDNSVTTYKANKFHGLPALVVPVLLLVPLFESGTPIQSGKLLGFGLLSLIVFVIYTAPLALRLEVGKDYVKSYFLGFCVADLRSSNIQVVVYGNLFRGGLGYGKGLNIRALKNGRSKAYSVGEKLYGKEAIGHIRRVLEMGGKK